MFSWWHHLDLFDSCGLLVVARVSLLYPVACMVGPYWSFTGGIPHYKGRKEHTLQLQNSKFRGQVDKDFLLVNVNCADVPCSIWIIPFITNCQDCLFDSPKSRGAAVS